MPPGPGSTTTGDGGEKGSAMTQPSADVPEWDPELDELERDGDTRIRVAGCRADGAVVAAGWPTKPWPLWFVDLCDTFHIPVVTFQDCPGIMTGRTVEAQGTIRKVLRARMAIAQSTVPRCTFFVRRAFGVGGALHGPLGRASVRYAWPSARGRLCPWKAAGRWPIVGRSRRRRIPRRCAIPSPGALGRKGRGYRP
jgi:hypothetical protein